MEDTDSVTSLDKKLDEAALTLQRANMSLPAVGIEQQHASLQEENKHLRNLIGDLIVHGKDFVTHHDERSEREHNERLAKRQQKQTLTGWKRRSTKATAAAGGAAAGGAGGAVVAADAGASSKSSKSCTIL